MQVVANLLNNAAKYTEQRADLSGSSNGTEGGGNVLRVKDTGVGIARNYCRESSTSLSKPTGLWTVRRADSASG